MQRLPLHPASLPTIIFLCRSPLGMLLRFPFRLSMKRPSTKKVGGKITHATVNVASTSDERFFSLRKRKYLFYNKMLKKPWMQRLPLHPASSPTTYAYRGAQTFRGNVSITTFLYELNLIHQSTA